MRVKVSDDSIGSNTEYHTVSVAAGGNKIEVRSNRFIKGKDYYVTIIDTDQYESKNNSLTVNIDRNDSGNTINQIVAKDGNNATFTFSGDVVSGWDKESETFTVSPVFPNTSRPFVNYSQDETHPGTISASINEFGEITLTLNGALAEQDVTVSATNGGYKFEKTVHISGQAAGTLKTIGGISTKLDQDYYFVSVELNVGYQKAVRDDITASDITAESVKNSGTLSIASVSDEGTETVKASKLVLDVNRIKDVERTISVKVNDGTESLSAFAREGASTVDLFLNEVSVGTQYSKVTIEDSYSYTVNVSEDNVSEDGSLTLTGFATDGEREELTIKVMKGFGEIGTWTLPLVDEEGKVTLDGTFAAGDYTVIVSETRTLTAEEDVTTKSLASLTATDKVTNTSEIKVTDAEFTAGKVSNTGTITIENSQFTVAGTPAEGQYAITNAGAINIDSDSLLTAQSIDKTNGTIAIQVKDDFAGMRKIIDLTDDDGSLGVTSDNYFVAYDKVGHDYWLADVSQTTLYVNSGWTFGDFGSDVKNGGETVAQRYSEYNAFGKLEDFMYTDTGTNQTAKYSSTEKIMLHNGDTYSNTSGSKLLYYTDGNLSLTGDAQVSAVNIKASRFYLMSAVEVANKDAYTNKLLSEAAALAPTITIDPGLTLNLTTGQMLLKVGDVLASDTTDKDDNILDKGDFDSDGNPTRTAGIANLVVNGTVNGGLYLAPYSMVRVEQKAGQTEIIGKVLNSTTTTYLRENTVMTVEGTSKTGPLQFQQGEVRFMNGGTLTLTNTLAEFKSVAIAPVASQITQNKKLGEESIPAYAELNLSNTTVNATAPSGGFFVKGSYYDSSDQGNRNLHLNLTNGSTLNVTGNFNPLKDVTVNIDGSTLSVTGTVTNNKGATIKVTNSDFEATSLENYGSITLSGANTSMKVQSGAKSTAAGMCYIGPTAIETVKSGATLTATSLWNQGQIIVESGGAVAVTGNAINEHVITITGVVDPVYNDPATKITSFTVNGTLTNTGTITVNSGVSTLTVNDMLSGESVQKIHVKHGATLKDSTITGVGGTVAVDADDATVTLLGDNAITTIDVSGSNSQVNMNWKSTLTFTSFTDESNGKFHIDLSDYDGSTDEVILDHVGASTGSETDWENYYKALLGAEQWSDYYYVSGDDLCIHAPTVAYVSQAIDKDIYHPNYYKTVEDAVTAYPSEIIVLDGTLGTSDPDEVDPYGIPLFSGFKTTIQDPEGTGDGKDTIFTRAVYGGLWAVAEEGTEGTPVSRNIDVHIDGGTFRKFFVGGNDIALSAAGNDYYVQSDVSEVKITDGLFLKVVAGGDRFEKGTLTRKGGITVSISGGTFEYRVAGGLFNSVKNTTDGNATIEGNVNLNITGGTFATDSWIFGGCISAKSQKMLSMLARVDGNTCVTVDTSAIDAYNLTKESTDPVKKIVLGSIAAGSHGWGGITGNASIVFKGTDDYLEISGELWGGSSAERIDSDTGKITDNESSVGLARILSFEGFDGAIKCTKIRAFSDFMLSNSHVVLDNSKVSSDYGGAYKLSGMENWTFDETSTLAGDFENDFAGDTLILSFSGNVSDHLLITDSDTAEHDVFNGFSDLKVKIGNTTLTRDSGLNYSLIEGTETLSWTNKAGCTGSLVVADDEGGTRRMKLNLTMIA